MLKLDWSLLWTALNVLIWYILIKTFLFKPVNNIIAKRNEKNQAIRKEAEDARAEALALKEQYQKMIDGAEAEGEAIKEKSREEAKVEYEHIVEDAGKKAQVVMDEAHIKIEEEHKKMLRDSENQMADFVIEATRKLLVKNSGEENDTALYEQFLAEEEEKIGSGK